MLVFMPPEIHVTPRRPNRARQLARASAGLALGGMLIGSAAYLWHNHQEAGSPAPTPLPAHGRATPSHQDGAKESVNRVTPDRIETHHIEAALTLARHALRDHQPH